MKRKILAIAATLLCVAALICGGIFAASAEETPAVAIKGHTLALQNNLQMVYYVTEENIPQGATTGILIWVGEAPETYTYENAQYVVTEKQMPETIEGVTYQKYYFGELAAKQMTDNVYAVPFVKDGNDVTYGKFDKYSVIDYAYNKKDVAELSGVLDATLNYGAEAQKYFGYHTERLANADFASVTVEGGTLDDGTVSGLFPVGAAVTLIPDETEPDFALGGWTVNGKMLAADSFTVSAAGNSTVQWVENYFAFALSDDETSYTLTGPAEGVTAAGSIVIPSEYRGKPVTAVGEKAFYNCESVLEVTIPESVTHLGHLAFDCPNLATVTIESDAIDVRDGGFADCPIRSATVPTCALASIPKEKLEILVINGGTGVDNGACMQAPVLTSVTIGGSVTDIGASAFLGCPILESVTIGDSVRNVAAGAFCGCPILESVTIGDSVESIGGEAFYNCGNLTDLTIGKNAVTIGDTAFKDCDSVETLTAPTFAIGFVPNDALKTLVIRGGTEIGEGALSAWPALDSVTIGDSVERIGGMAFYDCCTLSSVTIGKNVTFIGAGAFQKTEGLIQVTFQNEEGWWVSEDADATSGTSIDVNVFHNNSMLKTHLRETYSGYYWHRTAVED